MRRGSQELLIQIKKKKLGKESGEEFEDLTKQVVHRITFSSSIFLAPCLSADECCTLIQKEANDRTFFHWVANTSNPDFTWAGASWLLRIVTNYLPSYLVIIKLVSVCSTERNFYVLRDFYTTVFQECDLSTVAFIHTGFNIQGQHTSYCYYNQ